MSFSTMFLPFMIIIFPLIGCWMLVGNSYIYPNQLPMSLPVLKGYFTELDKELYLPFYMIISIIAFV